MEQAEQNQAPYINPQMLAGVGLGDILKLGIRLCRDRFWQIFLLPIFLNVVCPFIVLVLFKNIGMNINFDDFDFSKLWPIFAIFIVICIILPLAIILSIIYLTEQTIQGKIITIGASLKYGFYRLLPGVWTGFLFFIAFYPLLILFMIPAFIFFVFFFACIFAVCLRGKSGFAAFKYSKSIVKGNWWSVAGNLFAIHFLFLLCYVPFIVLLLIAAPDMGPDGGHTPSFLLQYNMEISIALGVFFNFVYYGYIVVFTLYFLSLDYKRYPQPTEEISSEELPVKQYGPTPTEV
ncbi:MAG: hypothetical protein HZB23_06445 [Deltaproteobacteria bacterium]|nr:hypothetical protein [Deltaproteobacteria bacterium]